MNGVSPPDNRKRPRLATGAPSDDLSLSTSRLPQIRAEVRIGLTVDDLDESGRLLNDLAIRRTRAQVDGMPARAWLTVDLGPLGVVDELLLAILAEVRCAKVTITSPDWRLAHRAALALTAQASARAS